MQLRKNAKPTKSHVANGYHAGQLSYKIMQYEVNTLTMANNGGKRLMNDAIASN